MEEKSATGASASVGRAERITFSSGSYDSARGRAQSGHALPASCHGPGEIGDGSEFQHIAAAAAALPQPPRVGQLRSAGPSLAEVPLADLS